MVALAGTTRSWSQTDPVGPESETLVTACRLKEYSRLTDATPLASVTSMYTPTTSPVVVASFHTLLIVGAVFSVTRETLS